MVGWMERWVNGRMDGWEGGREGKKKEGKEEGTGANFNPFFLGKLSLSIRNDYRILLL